MDYSKLDAARALYISVLKAQDIDTDQNIFRWNSFTKEETQYWIDRVEIEEQAHI